METLHKQYIKIFRENNESGFILIVALLMLALVTIIGIAATRTSETEVRISGNDRDIRNDFYSAESVLVDAMEHWEEWLTGSFLMSAPENASYRETVDINGMNNALMEVRFIEPNGVTVNGLSNAANDLPLQDHVAPPSAGSGYSINMFEAHRFGVTITSNNERTIIQAGVWCVFNKSSGH